jgi:mono/diheme cytochrome c family protein
MIRNLALMMVGFSLAAAPIAASAAGDAAKGKTLFETNCATCHGTSGKGDGPVGLALPEPKPRDFTAGVFKFDTDKDGKTGTDADLVNVVKTGAAAYGGNPMMAPWAQLPEADIVDIVAYVRTFHK